MKKKMAIVSMVRLLRLAFLTGASVDVSMPWTIPDMEHRLNENGFKHTSWGWMLRLLTGMCLGGYKEHVVQSYLPWLHAFAKICSDKIKARIQIS